MAQLNLRLTTHPGSARTLTVLSCGDGEVVVRDADGSVLVWRSPYLAQQVARFLPAADGQTAPCPPAPPSPRGELERALSALADRWEGGDRQATFGDVHSRLMARSEPASKAWHEAETALWPLAFESELFLGLFSDVARAELASIELKNHRWQLDAALDEALQAVQGPLALYDGVWMLRGVPEEGIPTGARATVIDILPSPKGTLYGVEAFNEKRETIGVTYAFRRELEKA